MTTVTVVSMTTDEVVVKRADLEHEHRVLLDRIQRLRRILGYEPLPTAKQQRKRAATLAAIRKQLT